MDLIVTADGRAQFGSWVWRCATGHGGFSRNKREGDGTTPVGAWPLRSLLYRADRIAQPDTFLNCRMLLKSDGWCDDPADAQYNRAVTLPWTARSETLWREDSVYDIIVPLGYNDEPVIPDLGSAIFLHITREDFKPTEGCVALGLQELLIFLSCATRQTSIVVQP